METRNAGIPAMFFHRSSSHAVVESVQHELGLLQEFVDILDRQLFGFRFNRGAQRAIDRVSQYLLRETCLRKIVYEEDYAASRCLERLSYAGIEPATERRKANALPTELV